MRNTLNVKKILGYLLPLLLGGLLMLVFINRLLLVEGAIGAASNVSLEWQGHTSEKKVALTFDDGPDPRFTPQIISILKTYHIPATFFLVGSNIMANPSLVKEEILSGFAIGNHTFSHPHLRQLRTAAIINEITKTDQALLAITGRKPDLFRPPYEELTPQILTAARHSRKSIIMSTVTLEHVSVKNAAAMANRAVQLTTPGTIILAHDGRVDRSETVAALPDLILGLTAKGYRFVSLAELLHRDL